MGKKTEMSPLRHFLMQEVISGLSCPLFQNQKDFILLATKTKGIAWFGKEYKNLKPTMCTQMKRRGEAGTQEIVHHHALYKSVVAKRLDDLKVDKVLQETIFLMFETAFINHVGGKTIEVSDYLSMVISVDEIKMVSVCMQGNGGRGTLKEIMNWITNFRKAAS